MGFGLIIQRRPQAPSGGGRNAPEWVAGINRNARPECIGIGGRNASEYALDPGCFAFAGEFPGIPQQIFQGDFEQP
jgi:hypothetical protein